MSLEPTQEAVNGDVTGKDLVWYLAYGSNMHSSVFQKRRQISPADARRCRVPGYFLSMDIPGPPYIEPSFASILKHDPPNNVVTQAYARMVHDRCAYGTPFRWDPSDPEASLPPTLEGVVYLVTHKQFERIVFTEGGMGYDDLPTGYTVVQVECVTYEGERLTAKTLMAKPSTVQGACQATPRYLKLLNVGAKQHDISPSYQAYLNSLQPFRITTLRKRLGKFIFLSVFFPFYLPYIGSVVLALRRGMRTPKVFVWYSVYLFRVTMFTHRHLFAPMFGSGQHSDE